VSQGKTKEKLLKASARHCKSTKSDILIQGVIRKRVGKTFRGAKKAQGGTCSIKQKLQPEIMPDTGRQNHGGFRTREMSGSKASARPHHRAPKKGETGVVSIGKAKRGNEK